MIEVWRYESPPGTWHYVERDPAQIKRPGEPGRWLSEAEAQELDSLERSLRGLGGGEPREGLSVWTRQALENLTYLRSLDKS